MTRALDRALARIDSDLVGSENLDPADSHDVLARHIATIATRALKAVPGQGAARLEAQLSLANRIVDAIAAAAPRAVEPDDLLVDPPTLLTAIVPRPPAPLQVKFPVRPETPLATGALLTNGRGQPGIGGEVNREMASADDVE
jgi:hypothetical protein